MLNVLTYMTYCIAFSSVTFSMHSIPSIPLDKHVSVAFQVRMAATLPAGLLERMIVLTESLLTAIGDKNGPTTLAAVPSNGNYQGLCGNAMQLEGVSYHNGVQATAKMFTSLAPVDISSNHVLHIKRRSDGSSSADGAEQKKSSVVREGQTLSRFVLDKMERQRQVMQIHVFFLQELTFIPCKPWN
jgi:hypothetical protein